MALVDDPKAYILQLFKVEKKRYAPDSCRIFLKGHTSNELPLDRNEKVYGIYNNKYFFSPESLIVKEVNSYKKIYWHHISNCSSKYNHENKTVVFILKLINGDTYRIRREELGISMSKISQLFQGMINRWGHQASFGNAPLTIEHFFELAKSDDCIGPNRIEITPLKEVQQKLIQLSNMNEIDFIKISILEYSGDEPVSDRILIGTKLSALELQTHSVGLIFSFVKPIDDNTYKLLDIKYSENIFECVWD